MLDLDFDLVEALRAGGVIRQRQPDFFLVRLKVALGELTSDQLVAIGEIAREFARGKVHLTLRQGVEIPWIRFDDLDAVIARLAHAGIPLGACGPRVRVVVACQGNSVCPHGIADTRSLATALDRRFYGRTGLPHKLKIGVTGCPNACAKPQEHDVGFMAVAEPRLAEDGDCIACAICAQACRTGAIELVDGRPRFDLDRCSRDGACITSCPTGALVAGRTGWNLYLGGRWGRKPRLGRLYREFLGEEESLETTERVLDGWNRLAREGERLGDTINRYGFEAFAAAVAGRHSGRGTDVG